MSCTVNFSWSKNANRTKVSLSRSPTSRASWNLLLFATTRIVTQPWLHLRKKVVSNKIDLTIILLFTVRLQVEQRWVNHEPPWLIDRFDSRCLYILTRRLGAHFFYLLSQFLRKGKESWSKEQILILCALESKLQRRWCSSLLPWLRFALFFMKRLWSSFPSGNLHVGFPLTSVTGRELFFPQIEMKYFESCFLTHLILFLYKGVVGKLRFNTLILVSHQIKSSSRPLLQDTQVAISVLLLPN